MRTCVCVCVCVCVYNKHHYCDYIYKKGSLANAYTDCTLRVCYTCMRVCVCVCVCSPFLTAGLRFLHLSLPLGHLLVILLTQRKLCLGLSKLSLTNVVHNLGTKSNMARERERKRNLHTVTNSAILLNSKNTAVIYIEERREELPLNVMVIERCFRRLVIKWLYKTRFHKT